MTDYAAAPSQPIVQGLMTIVIPEVEIVNPPEEVIGNLSEATSRVAAPTKKRIRAAVKNSELPFDPVLEFYGLGVSAIGLDANLNITLTLDQGVPGAVGLDPNYARTLITIRGPGLPPGTAVNNKSVSYPDAQTIAIQFAAGGTLAFPSAFEIIVWRGNTTPALYSVNINGPLFNH